MSDEEFHEIQLNGKQLVFLFMAATVVAVVIFLCGVMVGRGAPTRAIGASDSLAQVALDPTVSLQQPASQAVAGSGTAPVTAQETLVYPSLLEDPNPPAETLAPAPEQPPAAKPVAPAPKPGPSAPRTVAVAGSAPASPAPAEPTPPRASVGEVVLAEPPGNGFVVQVAAVRQRAEADTIARRLSSKGYQAFVTTSGVNYRVRVGKFTDRREAQSVAGRLEREEHFKPWITR